MVHQSRDSVTCPDCGSRNGSGSHRGSTSCVITCENREREMRGLYPLAGNFRNLLDEASVTYEIGRIYDRRRGKVNDQQIFVPSWAIAAIEAPRTRLWGTALTDCRPAWQRRRLLQLAALRWCATDESRRYAVEAVVTARHEDDFVIWKLFAEHVELDPAEAYPFARRGERTRRAVLARMT
jgi:hypothetical protein